MEGSIMTNISELELQNIRHLIGSFDTCNCKLTEYANGTSDEKLKQFFTQGAQGAMENKQTLMQFLQQEDMKMLDEKAMVNDVLAGMNGEIGRYGAMIPETENQQLKQTFKQFRNSCETSQEQLYKMAKEKQYYVPAAKATQQEVEQVRSTFTQNSFK